MFWGKFGLKWSLVFHVSPATRSRHNLQKKNITCCLPFKLTPWRQNPKVHYRVHSPPPVRILSQLDPLYTSSPSPKIHSDPVLPSTPWSSKWSLSFGLASCIIKEGMKSVLCRESEVSPTRTSCLLNASLNPVHCIQFCSVYLVLSSVSSATKKMYFKWKQPQLDCFLRVIVGHKCLLLPVY
jgi:hypothetical protein